MTERNRDLGRALAAARRAKGYTQPQVAERMKRNQAWVSRTETGTRPPSANELDLLLELYEPEDELRESIEELRTPPPAGAGHSRVDAKFMELKKAEQEAAEILVLTSERLPMSLQSEQFLLLQYDRAGVAINRADLLAEHRRRQVFTRENPPLYHALVGESACYRMPGGRLELVREQASYLVNLIDSYPNLRLQVLRYDADLPFLQADMVIVQAAEPPEHTVFFPFGATVIKVKGRDVSNHVDYWHTAREAALSLDESRKFLYHLAEVGYRQPSP